MSKTPKDLQVIGAELAIAWADGSESYILLSELRQRCPCASCSGEKDIFGNQYGGEPKVLANGSILLTTFVRVGGYGIQPRWGDGHSSGIFSFDYLWQISEGGALRN